MWVPELPSPEQCSQGADRVKTGVVKSISALQILTLSVWFISDRYINSSAGVYPEPSLTHHPAQGFQFAVEGSQVARGEFSQATHRLTAVCLLLPDVRRQVGDGSWESTVSCSYFPCGLPTGPQLLFIVVLTEGNHHF